MVQARRRNDVLLGYIRLLCWADLLWADDWHPGKSAEHIHCNRLAVRLLGITINAVVLLISFW